ncbi:hypothetical protein ASPWEDRAFT_42628 [Aspergillus wentii DTO 134E9]|uniref:Uncharacterized protein n=1 Tax=Aspergillus wentii DTO 134E9 TaxID=1073089 RepID=A0A1L9RCH6_ASPWE|nr:uncharacterized protein ASPWEDRAFT_42628 [Aspergillus wentii DTO 134E9]OJJ32612.1 hypothetical protein ASPWEDRAFT_42628 [Aspergillus wentii DTO 134E9]
MNNSCGDSVAQPPFTHQYACAFSSKLNSTSQATAQQCCGLTTTLNQYLDGCWQYCEITGNNHSAVVSCMNDADIIAAEYERTDASGASVISKPGLLGLATLVVTGLVAGTW